MEFAIIKQDVVAGRYVAPDISSPYANLVDEGLLSEEVKRSLREKIRLAFVTYEMVFEYLLSEIIIGEVTPESILQKFNMAQAKSFIQLRGAIVLALSLSLLRGDTDTSVLVDLAKLNRPDSRQFLLRDPDNL